MTTQTEAIAENIAREFHAEYEALALSFGYETRHESAVPWEGVPASNRALMTAVVGRLLERSVIANAR